MSTIILMRVSVSMPIWVCMHIGVAYKYVYWCGWENIFLAVHVDIDIP